MSAVIFLFVRLTEYDWQDKKQGLYWRYRVVMCRKWFALEYSGWGEVCYHKRVILLLSGMTLNTRDGAELVHKIGRCSLSCLGNLCRHNVEICFKTDKNEVKKCKKLEIYFHFSL